MFDYRLFTKRMMGMKCICWGDDHEDLTEKVYAAILSKPDDYVAQYSMRAKSVQMRRIAVKCSYGHENIFTGELIFVGENISPK